MIEHIVDKEIFQEVLRTGVTSRSEHFTLYKMNAPENIDEAQKPVYLQVGVVVPKRLAKKAVTRNAIRRQVYGIAKKVGELFPKQLHVVRLNKSFDRKTYLSPSSLKLKLDVASELQSLYKDGATL